MNDPIPRASSTQDSYVLGRIIAEEGHNWHFDPLRPSIDYSSAGNVRQKLGSIWDSIVDFARTVDQVVPQGSIFDYDKSQADDKEFMRSANLIKEMGYDDSTAAHHKTFSDEFPEVFAPITQVFDLVEPVGSLIHQKPGWVCPWHYDVFAHYARRHKVTDPSRIRRYQVFLEDWSWGHYFLVGNSVIHQWRAGDAVYWPYKMRHLSANAGIKPKLTLQVTGQLPEDTAA